MTPDLEDFLPPARTADFYLHWISKLDKPRQSVPAYRHVLGLAFVLNSILSLNELLHSEYLDPGDRAAIEEFRQEAVALLRRGLDDFRAKLVMEPMSLNDFLYKLFPASDAQTEMLRMRHRDEFAEARRLYETN